jgi:2-polyprenyl-3-methyl-5-hydroxy-6-metoxy-1,4-benzoquinol methylase
MPIEKYDFITMGEVLEHVEDPLTILQSLKRLMHQDSRLFITTCANSPALDHVYHFTCIDDIRNLLKQAGYHIVTEVIAPSEDKSPDFIVKHKLAVSYAAILKREE